MKSIGGNNKKILGIAIGERSLLLAELAAGPRPEVRRLAEFMLPEAGTPKQLLAGQGEAFGQFLRDRKFTARSAVVGIPARWLLLRQKDVPPADDATLIPLLRLGVEADFSADLKDLVYEFSGNSQPGAAGTVTIIATRRQFVEAAELMCRAAGLRTIAITPSALVLADASSRGTGRTGEVVLTISSAGAEFTAQREGSAGVIRHVNAVGARPPFSELRRAVSSLPASVGGRELLLWDGVGIDAGALGRELGREVRNGDLPLLGVTTSAASVNGEGRKYAGAVSLALAALAGKRPAVDFLHSRLAPPRKQRVPRWALIASTAAVLVVVGLVVAYVDLRRQEARVAQMEATLATMKPRIDQAGAFVTKVSFAQAWHGGDPRFLSCLRDLTSAMPEDGETYATNLILHEAPHPVGGGASANRADPRTLSGILYGKTTDQKHVQSLQDRIGRTPSFTEVKLGGSDDAGRGREVSFSLTFNYVPPAATP